MEPEPWPTLSTFTRFLHLPREIRDLIYSHMLVRDFIPISCAMTKTSSSDAFDDLSTSYPLFNPRLHRRFWPIPAFDMDLDSSNNNARHRDRSVYMTYQLDKTSLNTGLNLGVLQTSHQVYNEASKVFYGCNVFSFTADFRIPTAFAFLCDRPGKSLRLIKDLELALMEDNNIRGTPNAHYPAVRRSTDSLVLQYAYHWFTELCTLLSTPRIQLRKLSLIVETACYVGAATLQDSFERERRTWRGEAPLWLEPLLKIGGLEGIELTWVSRQPRVLRMRSMVGIMRRHMLARTQGDGEMYPRNDMEAFRFAVLHKTEEEESALMDRGRTWDEAVLDRDEVRYIEDDSDDNMKKVTPSYRTRRHVECAMEFYMDVCACFCVIN
jgi:hypothetical protein